ncbi:eukaryotic membrane protein family-domain-containing protein [Apiosordaria backusii]|uniref:Eukaryotic membrane protein family-domain-containing protein n=1 Tax=Apiosordaria backusii TaxID=314023 RepID=A0AA40K3H3_9PEZI|nr:eukaryotic membrane protein family-domain-containing protein [Apiosordaria backusii]
MATTIGEGREEDSSIVSVSGAPEVVKLAHRNLSGSISHLPSPMLTPSDPRPEPAIEGQLAHERATTSPTRGVPTPDPSEESQSDADPLTDSSSSKVKPHESNPECSNPTTVAVAKTRSRSNTKTSNPDGVRRLSASKMQELTAAPESLPVAAIPERKLADQPLSASIAETISRSAMAERQEFPLLDGSDTRQEGGNLRPSFQTRPNMAGRTLSTPPMSRRKSTSQPPAQSSTNRRNSFQPAPRPAPLELEGRGNQPSGTSKQQPAPRRSDAVDSIPPSPVPPSIPLPPMSVPTLLQLELAGQRPSPLYIHHSYTTDIPYESSAVKFERLKNVMMLPWFLERTIIFGALACLDAWLWTFTILPMRFCISLSVLVQWWCHVLQKEARWLVGFVWYGLGRMWKRGRRGRSASKTNHHDSGQTDESRSRSRAREMGDGIGGHSSGVSAAAGEPTLRRRESSRTHSSGSVPSSKRPGTRPPGTFRHRRTKSSPSNLTSYNKADLLQGAIIICSSVALMNLDASRMYHFIRAQSAIKLYAIYNLLEVGDRLMSALGQDVLECLFSAETLSRNSSGRSKVMLPLGMFFGALVYNILHSVILFYQVIALNVAVNSYSNALMTLLLSNQFVEIKSTVFKRFEKENTFQLACADIVERFQLWIMLVIIAMRNIVEVGGFWVPGAGGDEGSPSSFPLHTSSILPASFTIMPSWLWSGEVLSPFFVVIGSEMVVDWIKHAFVNKFNNIKPTFYSRILDILCKDYYTNAFVTPSLTRRLGLPVMPLSCLFIRASVQIYNMFLATHLPTPLPPSTQTALSVDSAAPSPAMVAALDRLDNLIRNALGRAVYGSPYPDLLVSPDNATSEQAAAGAGAGAGMGTKLWMRWQFTSDDIIAGLTMVVVFLLVFLLLLIVKMLLGMVLLRYSRDRYAKMKMKEHAIALGKQERESFDAKGRRVGGYGNVEVGDDRRRWIFADDPEGLRKVQERDKRNRDKEEREKEKDFSGVVRYEMVARRIW